MKNKVLLMLVLGVCLFWMPSVMAANVTSCETALPGVVIDEKIPNAVYTVILLIKIAVPVLLVVFGMMDLVKAVIAQKEDEIKKGQHTFIKRLIAAALVFFVTSIVQLVISFVGGDDEDIGMWDCVNCFLNKECGTDKVGSSVGSGVVKGLAEGAKNAAKGKGKK